jgi:predicted ester cyclase
MRGKFSSLVLSTVLAGCAPRAVPAAVPGQGVAPQTKGPSMESTELERNRTLVRRLYEECINQGKLELAPRYIDESYVGIRGERGAEGFAGVIANLRRGIPDIRFTLEDVLAERDEVVVRSTWRGTHLGPFAGFEPTGKRLENSAIAIYRVRDEKIIQTWLESDRLGILQSLGVVDPKLGMGPGAPLPPAQSRPPQ